MHSHLKTLRLSSHAQDLRKAADMLRDSALVAFPTETVYGLGGDATSPQAVAGIFAAKGRPSFNPLIAHIAHMSLARREAVFDIRAEKLAEAFWPGPLTLVLLVAGGGQVCELARAGLPSVAVRIPSHPIALEILRDVKRPIAAPSANRSGKVSPTTAEHVLSDLDGRISAVVDGGPCQVGVESTILSCLNGQTVLLRAGGVTREDIEAVLGEKLVLPTHGETEKPLAPGMLSSHYAPRARVRLNATSIYPGEAALLFGAVKPKNIEQAVAVYNLSVSGDTLEAASHLFAALRELDQSGAEVITVMPIPDQGLGAAINDRLFRAAAER